MSGKQRLSASVDTELIAIAERAAARGEVATVSAWVNDAMRLKRDHDRRLQALAAFIADFENEHGELTREEMADAVRAAKRRAVPVRGVRAGEAKRRYGR